MTTGSATIKYNSAADRRVPGGRILAFLKTLLSQNAMVTVKYSKNSARISWVV